MSRPINEGFNVLNWASQIENGTIEQAQQTAQLPFVAGHVALMPDAHIGKGSTIGSVIPTQGAIIPAAIGVDIGCGMIAAQLVLKADQLPDNIDPWRDEIEKRVPGGIGKLHGWNSETHVKEAISFSEGVEKWQLENKAISQCGTLGGGNHFIEICLDEEDYVWVVLHSGSRGVGNQLAQRHIKVAQKLMEQYFIDLPNKDLAYLVDKTPEFHSYIKDMLWAQEYAFLNRDVMMNRVLEIIRTQLGDKIPLNEHNPIRMTVRQRINCHHNFTQRENHHGKNVWITRKGAIKAAEGDLGVIPGSMGTASYIVRGKGNPASYNSCSHGAGRKMSRRKAMDTFTENDLKEAMKGKTWLEKDAKKLVDEIPGSYKDIDIVMKDQDDLVEIIHTLHQILNYKGVS